MNEKHIEKEPLKTPIAIGAIGVFNNDYSSSIFFSNGFKQLDSVKSVVEYDYRFKLRKCSNIASGMLNLSKRVDLMIIMKGSGIPLQAIKLCSKHCRTLFWMMDVYSHFTHSTKLLENSLFCDYRTATGYGTCKLWNERISLPVYHIIDGSDISIYYPTKITKKYDVSFIGGSDKERDSVYNFLKNKFKVKFFGPKYSKRFVRPNEFRDICCSSKIVLNISRGHFEGYSSLRLWNLLACGSMVLTKHIPNMTERIGLETSKNIVEFKNFMELQRNIEYYLNNDEERNIIENNGLKFLKSNRTWKHSAGEVIDLVTTKPGDAIIPDITKLILPQQRPHKPKRRKDLSKLKKLTKKKIGISRRVKEGWVTA